MPERIKNIPPAETGESLLAELEQVMRGEGLNDPAARFFLLERCVRFLLEQERS